jgi:LIVCS family branched-chain amino acid:cation transporter
MRLSQIISIGVALFAMFFGAGNVVFPLDLGRVVGDQVGYAIAGLFLSGALIPIIGVFAGILFEGNYRALFHMIGAVPGEILIAICMLTIGPVGAIPRTLTLAHAGFAWYFPAFPLWLFTILAGAMILYFTFNKGGVVDAIGRFLAPIKIVLLVSIIVAGLLFSPSVQAVDMSAATSFWRGFFEGYGTLDLLVALFFAKLIFAGLDRQTIHSRALMVGLLQAGTIGAILLGVVYAGFMLTSAFHSSQVEFVGREKLIFALGDFLLGRLGILASVAVAVACLTTAIALTAVFADYVSGDLLRGKISYKATVTVSVAVICAFANLGFNGVMCIICPIAELCYPTLIMLALVGIAHKLFGFEQIKLPVYTTFAATVVWTLFHWWGAAAVVTAL